MEESPNIDEILKPPEHHQRVIDFTQKVDKLSDDFKDLVIKTSTNLDLDETYIDMEEIAKNEGDKKLAGEMAREGNEHDAMLVDEATSFVVVMGDKIEEIRRAIESIMNVAEETIAVPAWDYSKDPNIQENKMKYLLLKIQGSIAEDNPTLRSTMIFTFKRLDNDQAEN